ncbi:MAG: mannose-1-phosphate guanylyltransferase [Candidatus Methylomirabilales bacterium]
MISESYAVIMAGGSGERFWPLSTQDRPKQFLKLFEGESLLRRTVDRIAPLIPIDRQIVVTGTRHAALVEEEVPELPPPNLVCEPVGRNTAACIGLASLFLERRDPDATAVVLPADHHIQETSAFLARIEKAVQVARVRDGTVVIGVKPERPETGYGYMQIGPEIDRDVHTILQFHEKPDEETARRYLAAGNYFWNTGIFVWQNRTVQRLIKTHLPAHWLKLEQIRSTLGTSKYGEVLTDIYPTLQNVSIDYGVVEKAENIAMIHGRFDWDDLGSWTALDRILVRDVQDNVVIGRHVGLDTSDCIVYGQEGKIVATIGLRDLIIVETKNGLLICPKARSQEIRSLLGAMSHCAAEEREGPKGHGGISRT